MTGTVIAVLALAFSAAGNAVLGVAVWQSHRTVREVLRCIPEYRERATEGTARVYSPWSDPRRQRREEDDTA